MLLQTEWLQQHIEELNSTHNEQLLRDNSNEIAEQKAYMEKLEKNLEEKKKFTSPEEKWNNWTEAANFTNEPTKRTQERGDGVNVSKHIKILFTSNWVTINLALFKFFDINVFKKFGEADISFLEKKVKINIWKSCNIAKTVKP